MSGAKNMDNESKLDIVNQKTVMFYDDELLAVRTSDGHVYVSVRQMCDALRLDSRSQRRQIQNHEILRDGYQRGVVSTPHRGKQQAGLLRHDLVPLWLSNIQVGKVKEEIRPKLKRFQLEAAKALWEAFQEGRLTTVPSLDELLAKDTPAAQAYRMAQAMLHMARQQLILESRIDDHQERLEHLEAVVGDTRHHITPDQAMQISQSVKAVAHAMGGHKSNYQGVYGELYRKFGITSYKRLPKNQFEDAIEFLTEWYTTLTGGNDIPF